MKIKFRDRMILLIGGLLTVAAGVFLVVTGLQFQGSIGEALRPGMRVACIVGGALMAAFGVYAVAFPFRRNGRRQDFVVQKTDNGELRIAVQAVENQVRKCIDLHEEIRLVSMNIVNARSGVTVDLGVALANNISIPLAVASLQKQIKQYLAASSGIEVKEVRVSVEATEDDLDPRSAVAVEPAAPPQEEQAAVSHKRPLHQRLFGKANQPATMPPAPSDPEKQDILEEPPAATAPEQDEEPSDDPDGETAENPQAEKEMEDLSHE